MSLLRRIVVVGASLAGLRTVEALRRLGYAGELTLIGDESHLPYDRPPLSKEMLLGEYDLARLSLRREAYAPLELALRLGLRATRLDLAGSAVLLGGERVVFDGLVVATGARARRIPQAQVPRGVFRLRTVEDALALRAALAARPKVAIIGAGFIGAEVASSARSLGLEVTMIEAQSEPFANILGAEMGSICAALQRENGVTLRCGVPVSALEGEAHVRGVRLADGSFAEASCVVVGIGAKPNVEWLSGSGVALDDGVVCDEACRVRTAGGGVLAHVVAAGDVARFDNPLYGESMRVEHWTHAVEQANHAAQSLLGEPRPMACAPLFWSDQHGLRIQFAGRAAGYDALHVCHGSLAERRFVALYGRAGTLVAALAFRRPAQLTKYRKLIEARAPFEQAVRDSG